MTVHIDTNRAKFCARAVLIGAVLAATLLAGCELPMVREVREACAKAPDREACENAEYARRYEIEKQRNRRIAYP